MSDFAFDLTDSTMNDLFAQRNRNYVLKLKIATIITPLSLLLVRSFANLDTYSLDCDTAVNCNLMLSHGLIPEGLDLSEESYSLTVSEIRMLRQRVNLARSTINDT